MGSFGKFDGASQDSASSCGTSAFIYLNEHAYFNIWLNVGIGTNTGSEVCALWSLLYFSNVRQLQRSQIVGDALVVVNWVNVFGPINVISLRPWMEKIQALLLQRNDIQFLHILRDENSQADALSKWALSGLEGRLYFEFWDADVLRDSGNLYLYGP